MCKFLPKKLLAPRRVICHGQKTPISGWTLDNLSEADYKEHPNAWLIYGHEDGELWTEYTLDVYRDGTVNFTKYKDVDDDEPEFEYSVSNTKKDNAIELWKMICDGSVDDILKRFDKPKLNEELLHQR
jgi:hypothetical protein